MAALSLADENAEKYLDTITRKESGEFEKDIDSEIEFLTTRMRELASNLEFELAAKLRDEIEKLKKMKKKR